MAYDESLAKRVRAVMDDLPGYTEKKMFGGVGYLLFGNMATGVNGADLIVRVGPDAYESALKQPHTRVFDMTGRPMKGWVVVTTEGCRTDEGLKSWIKKGVAFAQTLPPK